MPQQPEETAQKNGVAVAMKSRTVAIIGLGAVGRLVASAAAAGGSRIVHLDSRSERQRDISFLVQDENRAVTVFRQKPEDRPDLYVITLKSYANREALPALGARMLADVPAVVLQNGMGNVEYVASVLPDNPVIPAITTAGVYRRGDSLIRAGSGVVRYGGNADLAWMGCGSLPWLRDPDIRLTMLKKLTVNAVINPLSAIYDVKNGFLLQRADLIKKITREIYNILSGDCGCLTETDLYLLVIDVARATADNCSSMLEDIRHGRKTEIESIVGYLLSRARSSGVQTPLLNDMYQKIKALEIKHA